MEQTRSPVDMLLDDDNTENIKFFDANNREVEFEQVAVIPLDERIYAVLKPVTEVAGVEDDEALVFVVDEIDDEDCLVIVEDERVVDRVFVEYYKLLEAEGIEVPEEYKTETDD